MKKLIVLFALSMAIYTNNAQTTSTTTQTTQASKSKMAPSQKSQMAVSKIDSICTLNADQKTKVNALYNGCNGKTPRSKKEVHSRKRRL